MFGSNWSAFLATQLYVLPFILIYLIGLALAILNWQRHPRVSLLCAIAFLLFLGSLALDAGKLFWMMNVAQRDSRQFSLIVGMVSMFSVVISSAAWGLILTAMFSGRSADRERM